ncbi:MAG: alkylhydroperoxidase [Robiginitomaculum sp.]|nr:MAG: alkylhydroperoxidase [Robiginitomaculum sp.]
MARVKTWGPNDTDDEVIQDIFAWVTEMEGHVPNHFYIEMNFPEYLKAKLGSTKVLWQMGELSMPEIQHVGILVSKANGCAYCTAAFCTILTYGLETEEGYVKQLADQGIDAINDTRTRTILDFALKVNFDAKSTTDEDVESLRTIGLTDKGIVQLLHLVSDFGSYNRLNLALQTDYDYRDLWRESALNWKKTSKARDT